MIEVSVVICTFNREKVLEECIKSLLKQNYSKDEYEILVIDNNSTDGTHSLVAELAMINPSPKLKLYRVSNQGLSWARNGGIKAASGKYILFIDDDALAEPEWISKMVVTLEESNVWIVGGKVILKFSEQLPNWMTKRFFGWLSEFIPNCNQPYKFYQPPWPVGCNMGFRSEAFTRVGLFKTNLGRSGYDLGGGEEIDLFKRMLMAGMEMVIQPEAVVHHVVPPERIKKDYFIRLNIQLGIDRICSYGQINIGRRFFLMLRYFLEIFGNIISYGIVLIVPVLAKRRFLRYLLLRRSIAKVCRLSNI